MKSRMRHITCIVSERQLQHCGHVVRFPKGNLAFFQEFQNISGQDIIDAIRVCYDGYFQELCIAIILCTRDRSSYFAYRLYNAIHVPISFIVPTIPPLMSIEVITIDQRTVTYRVVSMPGDGTSLFHSLCYILHGHIRLTLDIRRNIVSYVLKDWDRFKVWTDDGTGDNYTTQEHYKSEMLKPFTYGSACELMAAAELFGCRFQVYRNGQIFYTFRQLPIPLKHLRFTGDDFSSEHFDVYECLNSQKLDVKLSMKLVVYLKRLTDAECHFNTSPANTVVIETNHETQTDYDSSNPSCEI
ncbi:ANX10 protein, partial [Polypterus senegalus]